MSAGPIHSGLPLLYTQGLSEFQGSVSLCLPSAGVIDLDFSVPGLLCGCKGPYLYIRYFTVCAKLRSFDYIKNGSCSLVVQNQCTAKTEFCLFTQIAFPVASDILTWGLLNSISAMWLVLSLA